MPGSIALLETPPRRAVHRGGVRHLWIFGDRRVGQAVCKEVTGQYRSTLESDDSPLCRMCLRTTVGKNHKDVQS